jgi:putative transposase
MPKPYSEEFRTRVIADVATGASRREAAEHYGISPSVVVIWAQRFEETGSVAAKPSGGSTSPLEKHSKFLLALIAEQPDMTLDEIVTVMRKRKIGGSRSAVWRFFARHNFGFKKNSVRAGAEARGCGARTSALDARTRNV